MTKPLVIFVGERHDDFSYITLVDELVKSSEKKGLTVELFSEFKSQEEKIKRDKWNYPKSDGSISTDEEFAIISDKDKEGKIPNMEAVPTKWLKKTRSLDTALSEGKMPGYYENYHEEQEVARNAIRESEIATVAALNKDDENYKEKKSVIEKQHGDQWDKTFHDFLAKRDADYIEAIRASLEAPKSDVVIVWTGGGHVKPVAEGLGIPQDEIITVSNQDSTRVGELALTKFLVDLDTKNVAIPISIEEKLTELQKSKTESAIEEKKESFVEKLGLQKPDEKPRSFPEKYKNSKSKGGDLEL
jgi:hypothetical protein